jgi:hypothetical protein
LDLRRVGEIGKAAGFVEGLSTNGFTEILTRYSLRK